MKKATRFYLLVWCCCLCLTGCSTLTVQPVGERTYSFNDLDRTMDVRYGQPPAILNKFVTAKENFKQRLARRLPKPVSDIVARPTPPLADSVGMSVDYLAKNDLPDVAVRVNEYAPAQQLQRLRANKRVSGPLKYTLGMLSVAKYAMLPGPVLKTDSYNPYTNTLNLNSGNPITAVETAAFAKDLRSRKAPNLYLLSQRLPGGELPAINYRTNEVINYYSKYAPEQQSAVIDTMTTRFTTSVGSELADFIPGTDPLFRIGGAMAGKVAGKLINHERKTR